MATIVQYTDDIVLVTRWIARILALFLAFFVVVLVISTGVSFSRMGTYNLAEMIAFLIMWSGLIIAWRYDGLGGALITGGVLLFLGLDYVLFASVLRFWVFLIFMLPGLLFLYCWWRSRRRGGTQEESGRA